MLRVILCVLLFCATAQAEITDNVVRVVCGSSYGSGGYLGDGLTLTAAHVFRDEPTQNATITFKDGVSVQGKLIKIDAYWDQALVESSAPEGKDGYRVADNNVNVDSIVYGFGYGAPKKSEMIEGAPGRVIGLLKPGVKDPPDYFEFSGRVNQGSSGGPVLNSSGELVGNLWGGGADGTTAVNTGRTCIFLYSYLTRLKQWSIGGCIGGTCGPPARRVIVCPPQRPQIPNTPPITTPVVTPKPTIDYATIISMLKQDEEFLASIKGEKGAQGPIGLTGPPGTPGVQGEKGPQGDVGIVDDEKLALIAAAIVEQLKSDSEFQKLVTGPQGPPGNDGVANLDDLPPIRIQTLNQDGTVFQDATARLGDLIRLRPIVISGDR